jgi:hypothetical protein
VADLSVRPGRRIGTRFVAIVACIIAGAVFVTACGDDDSPSESSVTTPEDVKAPMSEVLAKLPGMVDLGNAAKSAAAGGDFTKAAEDYEELHEIWEAVEGTVKDTDPDIYEQIETAQGLIKDGAENENATRVSTGAADQADAVQKFVDANK